MTEEYTYTFTDEERQGFMLILQLLVKYLNQDLTLSDENRTALIKTAQELRKKIEFRFE